MSTTGMESSFFDQDLKKARGVNPIMLRAPKTLPRKLHILAVDFFFSEIVRATKVLERKQTQKSSLSVGATKWEFQVTTLP
jgi:hypothetical protein